MDKHSSNPAIPPEKPCDTGFNADDYMWSLYYSDSPSSLPEGWSGPVYTHTPININMEKGILRARETLQNRRKMIEKSDRRIEKLTRAGFGAGIALACFHPVIGLPVITASAAIHYINSKITDKAYTSFDKADRALRICRDYSESFESRKESLGDLHKTARHIYYWENTRLITSTIIKFAVGEIALLIGAGLSMLETKDQLQMKPKRNKRVSENFQEALEIIEKNLPHRSTPDFTP